MAEDSDSDCIAFAIYGRLCNKLAFARPGDAAWTILSWDWEQFKNKWGPFEDAVYYKGQFYVVNSHGTVMRCRIPPVGSSEKPAAEVIAFGPPTDEWVWGNSRYLVELRGELLQVLRRQWESETKNGEQRLLTDGFYIFRLNTDHSAWDMMYTLGDHAVFLGMSTTVAVPASDFRGCKRNCIYFTDDYDLDRWCSDRGGGCDTGYCTLVDKRIEFLENVESYSRFSPPIWVFPSMR
ncbi:putative F-box protein At1g65770 [Ananas comosus]|uniref:F-box protein At1g65770 n=1 Tax=Ananas comosus TaxID=4615 RepID=A0A6P5FT27_ANACO|nr:putative F-box protein At1g65770 [Ananas comosus]